MKKTQNIGMRKRQVASDTITESKWRSKGILLTVFDYNRLIESQGYLCAICGVHEDAFAHGLGVDHDHTNGKVRGLLCGSCNAILGLAKDSVGILESAVAYLLKEVGYTYAGESR
jgi:hypothetical protein